MKHSNETDELTPAQRIAAWMEQHDCTIAADFVPLSCSRNRDEKSPTLNYRVAVKRNGRNVLMTDYSMGAAHCPAYKASVADMGCANSMMRANAIKGECETGRVHKADLAGRVFGTPRTIPGPDPVDVLWSLSTDYSVIDAGGFEAWASDYGYDTDSRKAEATYRACLDIALALRGAFGDAAMAALQEAGQDY